MGIDCYKLYVSGLGISLPSKVSLPSSFIGTSGGMGERAECTDYDYSSAGKSKAAESITESLVSTKTKTPIDTKELTDLSTNSFCLLLEASFIPMLQRAQSANDNGCVSSTCGRVCCPTATGVCLSSGEIRLIVERDKLIYMASVPNVLHCCAKLYLKVLVLPNPEGAFTGRLP